MNLIKSVFEYLNRRKYFFAIVAFLLPFIFYFGVFFGRSFGLECAVGLMGVKPDGQAASPYAQFANPGKYCHDISDVGGFAWHHYANWVKTSDEYLSGHLALWNQNNGIGVPLAASFQAAAYFLPTILFSIPHSVLSFDIYFVFRFAFISLGMYLFLRSFKLPKLFCLIGSMVMFLNGYFTFVPTIVHVNVDIFLPWVALLINKAFDSNKLGYFALLSIAIALSTLGSFPESSVYIFLFVGLYFLFLSLLIRPKGKIKLLSIYFLSAIVGVGISALQILPGLEYLTLSVNSHAPGSQPETLPVLYSIQWLFPRIFGVYFGIQDFAKQLGGQAWWFGNYLGTFSSLFLLSSPILLLTRHKDLLKEKYFKYYLFFLVLLLFLVLQYFGIIPNVLSRLPLFSQTLYTKYSLTLINFLASAVVVFTLDFLVRYKEKLVPILALMIFFLIEAFAYFKLQNQALALGIKRYQILILQLILSSGVVIATTTLLLLPRIFEKKGNFFSFVLVLVCGVELFLYLPFVGDLHRLDSFRKPPFIDFLKQQDYQSSRTFSPDVIMPPDLSAIFNINDVRNLDALWPKNYYTYLKEFIVPEIDKSSFRFTGLREYNAGTDAKIIGNPFFDLLSVKYSLNYRVMENYEDLQKYVAPNLSNVHQSSILREDFFTIDRDTKPVLFEHAPGNLSVTVNKPENASYFYLYPAMSNQVFNLKNGGDGVKFTATASNGNSILFQNALTIDPKNNKADQKWFEFKMGPFPSDIKSFSLNLNTDQLLNNTADWAGWGGFKWDTEITNPNYQYKKIYNQEIKIYENQNFIPRIHPVTEVVCTPDEKSALVKMKDMSNVITTVSVNFGKTCQNQKFATNDLSIKNQVFEDQKVSFTYISPHDSYVVLSNLYYPGWKLKINGKEFPIDEANYTFEGLKLPKGENVKVEVYYQPLSFQLGASISIISSIVALVIFLKFRDKKVVD